VGYFRARGPQTRRLAEFLRRRATARPERRPELDCRSFPELFQKRAVVFTDTDDFTLLVARHGILHFLMSFDRALRALTPAIRRSRGRLLKVEADSLLLTFPDAAAACVGVVALEQALRRYNRRRPAADRLAFSYGIGYGDLLEIEEDAFGLEVNLASKLGEDRARRNEALLTPAAADALPPRWRRRLAPYAVTTFEGRDLPIQQLKLK
jgi:class 3 adenylate cyclase